MLIDIPEERWTLLRLFNTEWEIVGSIRTETEKKKKKEGMKEELKY